MLTVYMRSSETVLLARNSASLSVRGRASMEESNDPHLPHLVLEQVASHLEYMQDLIAFASTCRAARDVVSSQKWPSVKSMRLLHGVPTTSKLSLWLKHCSSIDEVDAENCVQLSNELLLLLSDLRIKVLKLNGCWRSGGIEAQTAVTKIAEAGCLEILDVRDTSIDIDTDLLQILSHCQYLRQLCAPVLPGYHEHQDEEGGLGEEGLLWQEHQEGEVGQEDLLSQGHQEGAVGQGALLWPSLTTLHFSRSDLQHNDVVALQPAKLRTLMLDDCPYIRPLSGLFFPTLKELTIKRAHIEGMELRNLGDWCPNLEKLDVSRCTFDDDGLSAIHTGKAAATAKLRHLILKDLYQPSSQAFKRLLTSLAKPLSVIQRADGEQVLGLMLDCSGSANVDDESFAGYAKRFEKWQRKGLPVLHVDQLRLCNCSQISHQLISKLASIGAFDQLQVLDLSNVPKLRGGGKEPEEVAEITAALCSTISAAGHNLLELNLDAATVSDEVFAAIARREWIALAAFKGLQELTIWRPCYGFTDSFLIKVLEQHPQLERFKLGMSEDVTDLAVEALPAGSLRELTLVACNAMHGHSIPQLTSLESLRLPFCDCFTEMAVMAIALSCKRLRMLELPSKMPTAVVPVASYDHLRGLRIEGGVKA
ncbi:hypothetical protein COCOBI_01-8590 [Coccomyxa sp. Obi]|nr:hypothetical protein COCOBI_01-8590 [Coccomyxa sp. Obi]